MVGPAIFPLNSPVIVETDRLLVRALTLADAPFILELLNEPAFHQYIGDKGVRDVAGAEKYLREGPLAMYARHGFGLWLVVLKTTGEPLGMCGLLQRDYLPDPDLGFALLQRHTGRGYAHESAAAVLRHGQETLKLPRILAITAMENPPSVGLLQKLGFRFQKMTDLPGFAAPSRLFKLEG